VLGEPGDFKYVARAAAHGSRQEIACSAHRSGLVQFWTAMEKEDNTFVLSVRRARRSGSCRQTQVLRETGVRLFPKGAHPAHRQRTRWETIDKAGADFPVWHVSRSGSALVVRPPACPCLLLRLQRFGGGSSGSSDDGEVTAAPGLSLSEVLTAEVPFWSSSVSRTRGGEVGESGCR
jgi:hypothetical protein